MLWTLFSASKLAKLRKEPPLSHLSSEERAALGVKALIKRRDIQAVLFYVFILGGSQWCYLTYMELYLAETLGFSVRLAAGLMALGQWLEGHLILAALGIVRLSSRRSLRLQISNLQFEICHLPSRRALPSLTTVIPFLIDDGISLLSEQIEGYNES